MIGFFVAGFIDSIAGGGGLITTPMLLTLGVPAHYVLGSAKLSSMLGSATALFTFWRGGKVIPQILAVGTASSFAGGVLGSRLALCFNNETMTLIMIVMIPIGVLISLLSGSIKVREQPLASSHLALKAGSIGIVVGIYEGVFGPGAGSFFLIAIHVVLKAGLIQSSATAKAYNIAANLGAVCSFAVAGTVSLALAIPCAVGSIAGNRIGAKYAMKVGPKVVRTFLYGVIAVLLASLVVKVL